MNSLGGTTRTGIRMTQRDSINLSFVAKKVFPVGAAVVLKDDREVDSPAAATDKILGVVYVPNKAIGDKVTIVTPIRMVVNGRAKVALEAGDVVQEVPADTIANGFTTYTKGDGANQPNVGIALHDAAIGADVEVGIIYI